ncbi:MAG: lytic murein transglycosylase B [Xanthomonadaceae bacterium]|nr:lytic murein transglycosylase B [Xanthomonadaceae bacterium]MDE2177438.1 lytic murein transglycosylase B [Xanthomonadaceae bacterium]MDE2246030.1 lytic murein transglycosylase B [Xanthomonadaceae bacterium]
MPPRLRQLLPTVSLLALAGCAGVPSRPAPVPQPAAAVTPPSAASLPVVPAAAIAAPDEAAFVRALVAAHPGLDAERVTALLQHAAVQPSILAAMARPAEAMPWRDYRPIFVNARRIGAGVTFYREHRVLVDATAARYGIPPTILVALLGVETNYGRITGRYRVLDALVTLGFHYPPRAAFFQKELAALLTLPVDRLPVSAQDLRGSYAGAMGWCQFMPSSLARYGVDADGDGRVDLWDSLPDILASTANYLAGHGWQAGQPISTPAWPAAGAAPPSAGMAWAGRRPAQPLQAFEALGYLPATRVDPALPAALLGLQGAAGPELRFVFPDFYVLTRYNSSPLYALAVSELADAIAEQSTDADDGAAAEPAAARTPMSAPGHRP